MERAVARAGQRRDDAPVLSRYLPSAPEVTKQVVIFLIAAIATAWVFSKVPALRSLRDDSTL
jgi:hypothetical protein